MEIPKPKKTQPNTTTQTILNEIQQNRIITIDSTSELLLNFKPKDIIHLITTMTHQNRNTQNFHFLLLTEGMQDTKAETTMNHYAEGSIYFQLSWTADSTMRHLIIRKLSGTIIPTRRLNYNLGKKGIIIETATRIT
jgi:hypothetical protein